MPTRLCVGRGIWLEAQGVILKIKLNQGLKSFDVLVMAFSVLLVCGISVPIIDKTFEGEHIDQAKRETEKLAKDLVSSEGKTLRIASSANFNSEKNSRSIASVGISSPEKSWEGNFGKDPWGKPYHFRFLKNKRGAPVQIVVWSDGPSQHPHVADIKLSYTNGVEEINFDRGDVVISKLSVR